MRGRDGLRQAELGEDWRAGTGARWREAQGWEAGRCGREELRQAELGEDSASGDGSSLARGAGLGGGQVREGWRATEFHSRHFRDSLTVFVRSHSILEAAHRSSEGFLHAASLDIGQFIV